MRGFVPVQTPDWQVSVCVQASPSVQGDPSAFAGFEQSPLAGSQTPASWHGSLGVQTTWLGPVHTPLWHASGDVQTLASSHAVPSGLGGFEQSPVVGSQVPASWHASLALQTTGALPTHTPP